MKITYYSKRQHPTVSVTTEHQHLVYFFFFYIFLPSLYTLLAIALMTL